MLECGLGTTQWQVKEYLAADDVFVSDVREPRNGRFAVLKALCTFRSISYLIGSTRTGVEILFNEIKETAPGRPVHI